MEKYSGFESFSQEAIATEELPAIAGGIEGNDDFTFPEEESDDNYQIEE